MEKFHGINTRLDMNYCLNCQKPPVSTETEDKKGEFEVPKIYRNGSTIENVFADTNLTKKIGSLNKYEQCECLGIVNNRYIVKYKVDNTNNYKVGFVKYHGGIK